MPRPAVKIGNIYSVPLGDGTVGFVQIAAKRTPIYAFDRWQKEGQPVDLDELVRMPILYLGNFFDSLIRIGDWKLLCHREPELSRIPFPCHKVYSQGMDWIVSWELTKHYPALAA